MNMRNLRLLASLIVIALLHGCAAAVIGGVGTAVVVAEDRRTVGTVAEDQGIELKAANRIGDKFKGLHINVTSYNRMALLTGEAPDAATRSEIEKIARAVETVRSVYNEIAIAGNTALTSKVKTRFIDQQKFNVVHVKVVTEANVVYLLGLVKHKEADDATQIARTTGGVQKVVRLFEYLD
jgi:osmotically-inducible protein OsmY